MSEELQRVATCPVDEINPMHPDVLRSPALMNHRLRTEAPVFREPTTGIFFVSGYDDVERMAREPETFSSAMPGAGPGAALGDPELAAVLKEGYPNVPTMLTQDPPLQRRYRRFVDGPVHEAAVLSLIHI